MAAVEQVLRKSGSARSSLPLVRGPGVVPICDVKVDTKISAKDFPVRPLPPAEAAAARGGFHAATARPTEARADVEQIRKADPQSAAAYEIEGKLLEAEQKRDEARQAYAKAVELGSPNFTSIFVGLPHDDRVRPILGV